MRNKGNGKWEMGNEKRKVRGRHGRRTRLRAETPTCTKCFGEGRHFGVQAGTHFLKPGGDGIDDDTFTELWPSN
jgi:hypothetical protein